MPAEEKPSDKNVYPLEPAAGKRTITPAELQGTLANLPPPTSAASDWPVAPRRSRVGDFWALLGCNAIVFGASVCIMVLELTASRLIAAHLGSSLYTWTSVIGVVLAGISLGNYLGGWLADRFQPRKVLAWLFLLSGVLTFSVIFLNDLVAKWHRAEGTNWQLHVMTVVAAEFLLPALALGTISPVTASMALRRSVKTGITVGNIYAWGAIGSIVGTFLAGFWLIGEFGTRQVIWYTSTALLVMGVLVAAGQRAFRAAVIVGVLPLLGILGVCASTTDERMSEICRNIAGIRSGWHTADADFNSDAREIDDAKQANDARWLEAAQKRQTWRTERRQAEQEWADWGKKLGRQLHDLGLTFGLRSDQPGEYRDESDYYAIRVHDDTADGDDVKVLQLDLLLHSYYNPQYPTKLHYDYEQVYAAVTERAAELWNRTTAVPLASLPGGEEFAKALPAEVRFDAAARTLSVHGAVNYGLFRRLLSIGPCAAYWQAVLEASSNSGSLLAPRNGDELTIGRLDALPAGIAFPDGLVPQLQYDAVLGGIVCLGPVTIDEAIEVMAQGEFAHYVRAVAALYRQSRHTSAMFIGGGGFVFPRWIEATFPREPRIDVAEIDPAVKLAAEKALGLASKFGPPAEGKTWVRTHIGDARKFVDDELRENENRREAGEPPQTYDFVYGDAFNDLSVPWHLTTLEFSRKVRDLLTPGEGVYLVNIIDIYPRAEYPKRDDRLGVAMEAGVANVPPALLPAEIPLNGFVTVRGQFPGLDVGERDGAYVLRYTGAMPLSVLDALVAFDPAPPVVNRENRTERQIAESLLKKLRRKTGFAAAVGSLYEKTNARRFLTQDLPAGLIPPEMTTTKWTPAPQPFQYLDVFKEHPDPEQPGAAVDEKGCAYRIGFRGVMSDETRQELLQLDPVNTEFAAAVESMYRQSHAAEVGKFLGRYVNTACEVFPYVYVFTSNTSGVPGDDRDTFIVACSMKRLDFENLNDSGGYWESKPFAWAEWRAGSRGDAAGELDKHGGMRSILELARGLRLEDNFAPVDNLLAPVFVSRGRDD